MPKTRGQKLVELRRKWAMRTALPPRKRPTAWELALDAAWQAREGAIARELRAGTIK